MGRNEVLLRDNRVMSRYDVQMDSTRNPTRSRRGPTAASSTAHRASVVESTVGIARFLGENLGPRLTAFIVGADPKTVTRWAQQDGRTPQEDAERRLRGTYQVFQLLQVVESPHTIRAWFMGMNPQLDDRSPAEALNEGQLREVMAAARAFTAGG